MNNTNPSLKYLDYSILQQCMHCGLCLPVCPTYDATKLERNSPRGRISLMRAIADGELDLTKTFGEEMYFCLGCLACTTACPAGVNYAELFEVARTDIETSGVLAKPARNVIRWLTVKYVFTHPRILRLAGRLLYLYQVTGMQRLARAVRLPLILPRSLRELEPLTPIVRRHFSDALILEVETPTLRRLSCRAADGLHARPDLSGDQPGYGGRPAGPRLRGLHTAAAILLWFAPRAQR